jgi:transcriptional regulator GlxA family with amidase domain
LVIVSAVALISVPLTVLMFLIGIGFGSLTVFREHFRRALSTSPKAYRAAFKSAR